MGCQCHQAGCTSSSLESAHGLPMCSKHLKQTLLHGILTTNQKSEISRLLLLGSGCPLLTLLAGSSLALPLKVYQPGFVLPQTL